MGSYLSITTLNVNELNAPRKRHRLAIQIQKQDSHIWCLQEIHLKPRDTHRLKVRGWKKIFYTKRKECSSRRDSISCPPTTQIQEAKKKRRQYYSNLCFSLLFLLCHDVSVILVRNLILNNLSISPLWWISNSDPVLVFIIFIISTIAPRNIYLFKLCWVFVNMQVFLQLP